MKLSRVDKQNMKYNVTAHLIKQIKKLYEESSIYEKDFLETVIGAAIFYLPTGSFCVKGFLVIGMAADHSEPVETICKQEPSTIH